jgi:glyoxylase-like metal-dependent hydrolase (beta-lactamase superfamily II)
MPSRPAIEVARDVFVMTSARYTTTTTMVRRAGSLFLVDPAWTHTELDSIVDWIAAEGVRVTGAFATHAHHDHMLWHPRFGDAQRWTTPRSLQMLAEWRTDLEKQLGDDFPPEWPNPFDGLQPLPSTTIPDPFGDDGADEALLAVEHDGHAPGHAALWLEERGVLLAGDMLSDVELPLPFSPDDLPAYLDALDRLAPVVRLASVLVPGHGHPTDRPIQRLDADRRYLDAVLAGGDPDDYRRGLAGMAAAHDKIVQMAAALRADSERY